MINLMLLCGNKGFCQYLKNNNISPVRLKNGRCAVFWFTSRKIKIKGDWDAQ